MVTCTSNLRHSTHRILGVSTDAIAQCEPESLCMLDPRVSTASSTWRTISRDENDSRDNNDSRCAMPVITRQGCDHMPHEHRHKHSNANGCRPRLRLHAQQERCTPQNRCGAYTRSAVRTGGGVRAPVKVHRDNHSTADADNCMNAQTKHNKIGTCERPGDKTPRCPKKRKNDSEIFKMALDVLKAALGYFRPASPKKVSAGISAGYGASAA